MSIQEQDVVKEWEGPVIYIDGKNTCPLEFFKCIGPGVFVRDFPVSWVSPMVSFEGSMSFSTVLYSENLLRLASIRYFSLNPSVLYWQRMRPLAFSQQSSRDTSLVLVVHDLRDLFSVLRDYPSESTSAIYVSSIGMLWESALAVSFQLVTVLKSRQIYFILSSHPIIPLLKEISQYSEDKDRFYFTFPVTFRCRDFTSNSMGCVSKLSIEVKEDFVPFPSIFPLRRVKDSLYLNSPQGIVEWKMDHPIRRWLIYHYFLNFGRPGWHLLLTGKDPKLFKEKDFVASTAVERDFLAFLDRHILTCVPQGDFHPFLWKQDMVTLETLSRQFYGKKKFKRTVRLYFELPGLPLFRDTG